MSGFEIIGVVLAAFPLALEALKGYDEVSRRFHLFHEIRLEYSKCKFHLSFAQVTFKSHLRRLLQPLIADEDKMNYLLSNPGGSSWVDQDIADLLQLRLGEMSELLIICIEGINNVIQELKRKLVPNSTLQDHLENPEPRISESFSKDNLIYRFKFCMGEAARNRHFEELERFNSQLEKILDMVYHKPQSFHTTMPTINPSSCVDLCNTWIHANALFKAMSSAWKCCCTGQHPTELLLQHRTTNKNEFNMLFVQKSASNWHIQSALITEGNDPHCRRPPVSIKATVLQSHCQKTTPIRSAPKKGGKINNQVVPASPMPEIECASIPIAPRLEQEIPCLCRSLTSDDNGCYGYLTEKDYKYYVCRLSRQQSEKFNSVTMDQILQREVLSPPSRRKRYALALTLASSFIQLLETPWLPYSWKKSDIVFIGDEKTSDVLFSGQPYLKHSFITSSRLNSDQRQKPPMIDNTTNKRENTEIFGPFELIGIVLLELCFGQLLEEHSIRRQCPAGNNESEKFIFDVVAARRWNEKVSDEAGSEFDRAIKWCFEGYRNAEPENWRKEMWRHVVRPLENCQMHLSR
ncbi:uncharacterized protein GGS22DRAFT_118772 [Annulohypoxylon maeteangense]|uniref:uncharacterized protein n=1 Tax=Annulohypoxylon maeteangense TaxID=1927788 RepID=UPI00200729B9|nr:uncharacterized protein GGS22DRAFT_118772 [Annulohypoxylon maeteangense]KAI0886875.1 hypothetical protein GGS22DRAFT_118772 [Annulohypoxylon maeteangense]